MPRLAHQVVAYNLTRARELRGLTQDAAAAALEPYLGVRWSKVGFSQAERSSPASSSGASTPRRSWPSPAPSTFRSPGSSSRHRLGDIEQWEEWLRTVADKLLELRKDTATTPAP